MGEDISGFFSMNAGYGEPDLKSFVQIPTSEGSFCDLYRGERMGKFRVYKCLKPQYRGSMVHEAMLRKEFETGYQFKHQNICEVYAFLPIGDFGNCIEMEWVNGITLEEYLKRGRPDETTFRYMAGQLCDAIIYLHGRKYLHRDLKPANIMIDYEGQALKLIDYGLADHDSNTIFKSSAGTRGWVAPEILKGGQADVRSEIYTLGAVLKTMTCCHRRCLNRCTRKNPEERYSSVLRVKDDLLKKSNPWPIIITVLILIQLIVNVIMLSR